MIRRLSRVLCVLLAMLPQRSVARPMSLHLLAGDNIQA